MSDYYSSEEYFSAKDAALAAARKKESIKKTKVDDTKKEDIKPVKPTKTKKEIFKPIDDIETVVKEPIEPIKPIVTTTTTTTIPDAPVVPPPSTTKAVTEVEEEQAAQAVYEKSIKISRKNTYDTCKANKIQEEIEGLKNSIIKNIQEIKSINKLISKEIDKNTIEKNLKDIVLIEKQIESTRLRAELLSKTRSIILSTPAPAGFHYMPPPTCGLMSDAEHEILYKQPSCSPNNISLFGLAEAEEKIIHNIIFDTSDINQDGETRKFTINASNGSVCDLEIQDSDDKYYNFYTNTFQVARTNIKNQVLFGGYQFDVVFPSITDGNARRYDIRVISKDDTSHAVYNKVTFEDNSIDLNSSSGSKSTLLRKVLYQTANKTLDYVLSATTPNTSIAQSTHLQSPSATSDATFVDSAKAIIGKATAFEVSYTARDGRAFQISRQPVDLDVFVKVTRTIGSDALPIEGEDTSSETYYRWPLNNIDGLAEGMELAKNSSNVTLDSSIKYYEEVITTGVNTRCARDVVNKRVEALDTAGALPTLTRDISARGVLVKTQTGNVVFDKQQAAALKDDTATFLAYGPEDIEKLTGWRVEFDNLKAELATVTTTTTSGVSSSTSIPVASGDGIVDNVSVMSGIGVNAAVVNPTVTAIGSYSGTTATLTVSSAQTLENGITLTFTGAGTALTISGNITFVKEGKTYGSGYEMPGWDGKFYFNLENFITATSETA